MAAQVFHLHGTGAAPPTQWCPLLHAGTPVTLHTCTYTHHRALWVLGHTHNWSWGTELGLVYGVPDLLCHTEALLGSNAE